MFDPKNVQISVAFVRPTDATVALTWNDKWQAFVLPMTKIGSDSPGETAEQAAVRAAAEVFQVPVRVVPGKAGKSMRTLQLGQRDGEIKDYNFTVVPVEVHPDFRNASFAHRPVVAADLKMLLDGDYQPISPSVKPILDACFEWSWL